MTVTGVGAALACGGGWEWHIDIRIELTLPTRYLLEVERLVTDGLTLSLLIFGSFALGISLMGTNPEILRKGHWHGVVAMAFIRYTPCLTCSLLTLRDLASDIDPMTLPNGF